MARPANRPGSGPGELLAKSRRFGRQRGIIDDARDKAKFRGLLGSQSFVGERQFLRTAEPDQPWQQPRRPAIGRQSDPAVSKNGRTSCREEWVSTVRSRWSR